ncbi:hypothetical protein P8452_33468 [Trifolium repens]|nr:hypothetical protein P8452_33468 [Trifolium repens]
MKTARASPSASSLFRGCAIVSLITSFFGAVKRYTDEKYISAGDWFVFVNNANLQVGSRLRFTLADPPQVLNVVIINPNV